MSRLINSDITDLMVKGLLSDIQKQVEEEITEKLVEDFRKKAVEIVKEHTKGLTLKSIETLRNAAQLREELYVKLDMGGGDVTNRVL